MPRQRIAFQLLHNQTVKPIEAAAQIYWRGGHQHPRSTSDVQHGSARSSSGNICTSEPVCSRTIQPCGLTTSTGQRDAGLGSRTSWNFTFGGTAARSKRNHRLRLDSPMLCWAANSFCVNRLWWNFASNRCRRLDVQCRRLFPLFCVSIPPWSHSLSPETRRGPSAAYPILTVAVMCPSSAVESPSHLISIIIKRLSKTIRRPGFLPAPVGFAVFCWLNIEESLCLCGFIVCL